MDGVRFEIPGRYRHFSDVVVRYARWDLSRVYLVDARSAAVLDRLYPLDKAKNADGRRRRLPQVPSVQPVPSGEAAPLLQRLLAEHAATGLPPGYLPLDDTDPDEEDE